MSAMRLFWALSTVVAANVHVQLYSELRIPLASPEQAKMTRDAIEDAELKPQAVNVEDSALIAWVSFIAIP